MFSWRSICEKTFLKRIKLCNLHAHEPPRCLKSPAQQHQGPFYSWAAVLRNLSEKPIGQFLGLIVMSHWLGEIWIWIQNSFVCFTFIFISWLDNQVWLSRGVQVAGAAWSIVTRIVIGVGDLVQRTDDGQAQVGYLVIGRSGNTVCGLHCAHRDEERGFLGWVLKPRSTIYQWFDLKTTRTVCQRFGIKTTVMVFSDLTSKPVVMVFFGLASKSVSTVSPVLASKPMS
jgi:hypothetical protein